MIFNSIEFGLFLPTVFIFYWFVFNRNRTIQNFLILVSSYVFYGWWDWRFLFLILFSTIVDFTVGNLITGTTNRTARKGLLSISILVNLGLLGFFKYYNFFIENFIEAFSFFGLELNSSTLNIILPVGISFYTFQTLSYTIDIYRNRINATKDFVAFAAFVGFFPQLVAGPIERASHLLPQFHRTRSFDATLAMDGIRQVLWGLFKKMVIADNCAEYVNLIFNNPVDYSGSTLLLGAFLFAFQIYGDFSGYSDIAIGTARLFGFDLMKNFAFPYFSRDIAEFWRRWHISLSTWFRDYLYIPLGGSRVSRAKTIRNIFIIFIVSGFWHGANWTFIIWGALNAIYFLPLLLAKRNRSHLDTVASSKYFPSLRELIQMIFTFSLTLFAWIFFRVENLSHAWEYLNILFSPSLFTLPSLLSDTQMIVVLVNIVLFVAIEWMGREKEFALQIIDKVPIPVKVVSTYILAVFIILFMNAGQYEFIYFQF